LREEEDFWGWKINEKYIDDVSKSFESSSFNESLSLLAFVDGKVVGRIDSSTIYSHYDYTRTFFMLNFTFLW
jgi:tetrahydromethanopterin S-methyltransferase subunit E